MQFINRILSYLVLICLHKHTYCYITALIDIQLLSVGIKLYTLLMLFSVVYLHSIVICWCWQRGKGSVVGGVTISQ